MPLSTALAVSPLYAQGEGRLDDGMRDRRLKLPTFLEETTTNRNDITRQEKKPETTVKSLTGKSLGTTPKKEEISLDKPVTDERGLRTTIIDKPTTQRRKPAPQNDDTDQKNRLRIDEVARAGGSIAPKKIETIPRLTGPVVEEQPHHPTASLSNPRTGVPPQKREKKSLTSAGKSEGATRTSLNSGLKSRVNERRIMTVTEVEALRRNSPLRPLQRAVPQRPYYIPQNLTTQSGGRIAVANPYARGAIIDPISGLVIPRAPLSREQSITGLALNLRDQATLRPFVLDNEAFASTGIKEGAFTLRPSIDLSTGFDSNPTKTNSSQKATGFMTLRAGLSAQSDFTRHSLSADISGSMTAFTRNIDTYRPELTAKVNGRIDIYNNQTLDLETRYRLASQGAIASTYTSLTGVSVKGEPLTHVLGAGAAYSYELNPLTLTLKGSIDRTLYEQVDLSNNTSFTGTDRAFNTSRLALRGMLKQSEDIRPFVEVFAENRNFDVDVKAGVLQGSNAYGAKAGIRFEQNKLLTGEIAVGYASRNHRDPTLADLRGLIFDAGLIWAASGLTNVTLKAGTSFDETILAGVSTIYRRDISAQIDHAFRRHIIGSARLGFGYDSYEGTSRIDTRMALSTGLNYRFTREMSMGAEFRHERMTSTLSTAGYSANIMMLGVKLQR